MLLLLARGFATMDIDMVPVYFEDTLPGDSPEPMLNAVGLFTETNGEKPENTQTIID
jgi:hypothetical protein